MDVEAQHGVREAVLAGLAAFAVATVLFVVFRGSAFPPGGDPGHMLALSHAVTGEGPEGPLRYAPGVPALLAAARFVAPDDAAAWPGLVKVVGFVAFFAYAAGLAFLAHVVAGGRAGLFAFVVAVVNPLAWAQVLWGGYPQFVALAASTTGFALFLRALAAIERAPRRRHAALAGLAFGVAVLTHAYTTVFTAAVALGVVGVAWRRDGGRVLPVTGLVATVTAAVGAFAVPVYARIAADARAGAGGGYASSFADIAIAARQHSAAVLFSLVVVAIAFWTPRGPRRALDTPALGLAIGFGFGVVVLAVVTPPMLIARVIDFLAAGLIVAVGAGMARLEPAPRGPDARRAFAILIVGLLVANTASVAADAPRFAPLGDDELAAFERLRGEPEGRVLVVSPWPNVDGWWLEGLTGRPALIGDLLKWYALESEAERARAARILAHGPRALDGGAMHALDATGVTGAGTPAVWLANAGEFYALVENDANLAAATLRVPGAATETETWRPIGTRNVTVVPTAAGWSVTSTDGPLVVEREVTGTANGVRVTWRVQVVAPGASLANVTVAFTAAPGTAVSVPARDGDHVTWPAQFVWERLHHDVAFAVDAPGPWTYAFDKVGAFGVPTLRFTADVVAAQELTFALNVSVAGIRPGPWRSVDANALLEAWDVSHVYVRGDLPRARERFDTDPRFETAFHYGNVTVYRVLPPGGVA